MTENPELHQHLQRALDPDESVRLAVSAMVTPAVPKQRAKKEFRKNLAASVAISAATGGLVGFQTMPSVRHSWVIVTSKRLLILARGRKNQPVVGGVLLSAPLQAVVGKRRPVGFGVKIWRTEDHELLAFIDLGFRRKMAADLAAAIPGR
jgi:hypothetical protein